MFVWNRQQKSRKRNNESDDWVCSVPHRGSKFCLRIAADTGFSFRSLNCWQGAWPTMELSSSWSYHWSCSFFFPSIYSKWRWRWDFASVRSIQYVVKPIHPHLHSSEYSHISMHSTTASTGRNLSVSCLEHFSSEEMDLLYPEKGVESTPWFTEQLLALRVIAEVLLRVKNSD